MGHGVSAVEGCVLTSPPCLKMASWATAFQPWKVAAANGSDARSMGSMGPRRFSRRLIRLNESEIAMLLQWGHGVSAVEGSTLKDGQWGLVLLQWGHGVSAVEGTLPKRQHHSITAELQWATRLPWKAFLALPHSPQNRFNGATAFQPWKALCFAQQPQTTPLQWGHGVSAVEGPHRGVLSVGKDGLMGHGVSAVEGGHHESSECGSMLQWGHGVSAWKAGELGTVGAGVFSFNGATAFQPWKVLALQVFAARGFRIAFSSGGCPVGGNQDMARGSFS